MGRPVLADLHIRVLNAATGEPLRELTLDPTRNYQPTGAPKGPTRPRPTAKTPNRNAGSGSFPCLER